jgi:putative flippase GtrA
MYRFLLYIPDIDKEVENFWKIKIKNIKKWYLNQKKQDDLIISASPEFLLKPICSILGVSLIASVVDKKSGKYSGENCHGKEKVKRMYAKIPHPQIEEFYSDSLSDEPLAKEALKAFIVDGNDMISWEDYEPSKMTKIKQMFFSGEFIMFIIVGVVNTFNGVLFAWLYSLFIKNANLAFIVGYITSTVISYILNSVFTFKERFSVIKYIKFFISYIPNFIIQNIAVIIFYNILSWPKIPVYALAAVIGVPVTFLFMKIYAFKNKK